MNRSLDIAERWIQRAGLLALLTTLVLLLWGVWQGIKRPLGRKTGHEPLVLRTPTFYLMASVGYFGLCLWLWRPLKITLSLPIRALALLLGTFLYVTGLVLVSAGRLTLGRMYNVSSSLGAQLYADQQLVTHGPFAYVRHPMYLGILFVGWGGLFLYRTWTFAFIIVHFPGLIVRAWHEEEALTAVFGEQWANYCRRVPAWWPRILAEQQTD